MTPEQERDLGRLMVLAQDGDRHAYEELLTRVAALVQSFVRRRTGDASWSEDVVQDALVALHRARHTYDARRPFAPWMYATAQNRLVDAPRTRLVRWVPVMAGAASILWALGEVVFASSSSAPMGG